MAKPPPGHPRACQAKRKSGIPCGKWAMRGSNYCKRHGAHNALKKRNHANLRSLPMFYGKRLGKTLTRVIEEQMGVDPQEQLSVLEELTLMKETCVPTLAAWERIHEAWLADPGNEKLRQADELYGTHVRALMGEVVDTALKAERIVNGGKDKFSLETLLFIRNQIIKLMYDVCERHDVHDVAREFESLIVEHVRLPKQAGTDITPDEDVTEMDDSIPGEPDADAA